MKMTKPKEVKIELTWKDLAKVKKKWTQANNSVDEIAAAQLLQFLKPSERIHFVNEAYRVLKKGGKCQILTPHWCASRAWGDLAFEHPPVAEPWYHHLNEQWRKDNAPWGKGYKCDFDCTYGYSMHPGIQSRNQEYQHHAIQFWKESAQDMMATIIKR